MSCNKFKVLLLRSLLEGNDRILSAIYREQYGFSKGTNGNGQKLFIELTGKTRGRTKLIDSLREWQAYGYFLKIL